MPRLLDNKGNVIVEDPWEILPAGSQGIAPGVHPTGYHSIVPLAYWQEVHDNTEEPQIFGVWFASNEEPEAIAAHIKNLKCIAIYFPNFMDGRGFSLARIIRERYGFQGELRAFGNIIVDQLFFLSRCGFDTYLLDDDRQVTDGNNQVSDFRPYFKDFTVTYQSCTNRAQDAG
jgi:uncharacterized protein (DUF934 family)